MTRYKVMADHEAFPVWRVDPRISSMGQEMVGPEQLPVSPSLLDHLASWCREYEVAIDDEWSPEQERLWVAQGRDLARRLQRELGDGDEVVYFNETTAGTEDL